ncbi:MAG: PTS fructose transporter subunit IIA, partial [Solobacterium sp.]|nr:PTS fructose transporter subunit IIA [Solobacterium sp.]
MIGVIVTGHGKFASGMESALKLLAGKPEKFTSVDFRQ